MLDFTVTALTGVGFGGIVPVTCLSERPTLATRLGGAAILVARAATLAGSILETELRIGRHEERAFANADAEC